MLTVVIAIALQSTSPSEQPLLLLCIGQARFSETAASEARATSDFDVTKSVSASSTTTYRASAPATVSVELTHTGARLRLPSQLIPMIRSGGDNGWWSLDELQITDTTMTGRMRLNPINRPKVSIDRRTGEMQIATLGGGFTGACKRVDATPLF